MAIRRLAVSIIIVAAGLMVGCNSTPAPTPPAAPPAAATQAMQNGKGGAMRGMPGGVNLGK